MPIVTESYGNPRQRLTAHVAEVQQMAGGITLVRLDPGGSGGFRFQAGQYVQLRFGNLPPRDYSIGSRPDEPLLEFHIRDTGDGGASSYAAQALRLGEEVGIDGPFGRCFLQEDDRSPLLAIAGGSGLAPMKSILETALAAGFRQNLHLYFGVRRLGDIYLEQHFRDLATANANLHFHIVLSEEEGRVDHRTGLVTDAIAQDLPDLTGFVAYMAGPPPMIEAAGRLLLHRGMKPTGIHADPFFTEAELAQNKGL